MKDDFHNYLPTVMFCGTPCICGMHFCTFNITGDYEEFRSDSTIFVLFNKSEIWTKFLISPVITDNCTTKADHILELSGLEHFVFMVSTIIHVNGVWRLNVKHKFFFKRIFLSPGPDRVVTIKSRNFTIAKVCCCMGLYWCTRGCKLGAHP